MNRYIIVPESQSRHCCFGYTVVDTTLPKMGELFEPLCECWAEADAQLIVDALNAREAAGAGIGFRPYSASLQIPEAEIPGSRPWQEARRASSWERVRAATGVMMGAPADAVLDTAALYSWDGTDDEDGRNESMKATEVVIVGSLEAVETFCPSCGQLRLYCKREPPRACGGCGAGNIRVGPVGSDELTELKRAWRPDPSRRYPCLGLLDAGGLVDETRCPERATYFARGHAARRGHLCGDCWQALPDGERELYAPAAQQGESSGA
jgi:hypothetical protein